MSTDSNPFTDRGDYVQPASTSPVTIILIVLAVLFFVFLGCVGFIGTATYQHVRPAPKVTLPSRETGQANVAAEFRNSVKVAFENKVDSDGVQPSPDAITDAVQRTLSAAREGSRLPLNVPMFIESVMRSPFAEDIGFADQLMLRNSLNLYPPELLQSAYAEILAIHRDPSNPQLATVDLLLYADEQHATSNRWYLVEVNDRWELYDWLNLEFALRASDEWALFYAEDAQGTSRVLSLIERAESLYYDNDEEDAYATLRRAESVSVHPAAAAYAKLQIAYTWMDLGDYAEAKRVLLAIDHPDSCLGVWISLADCGVMLGEYEEGIRYAEKALAQCERHPNSLSTLSALYSSLEREQDSADALADSLRLLPADSNTFYEVWNNGRIKDLPALLASLTATDEDGDYRWLLLVTGVSHDPDWGDAVLKRLQARDDVPKGIIELTQGELAAASEDLDGAARWCLKAIQQATSEDIRERARSDHRDYRLRDGSVKELFAESQNARETLINLLDDASEYGLEGDYLQIAQVIETDERLSPFPIRFAAAGYLYSEEGDNEKAAERFERFLQTSPTLSEDEIWIEELAESRMAVSWLESGKIDRFLQRWANDESRVEQALGYCTADPWGPNAEAILISSDKSSTHEWIAEVVRAERGIVESQTSDVGYGDLSDQRRKWLERYANCIVTSKASFEESTSIRQSLAASLAGLLVETGLPSTSVTVEDDIRPTFVDAGIRLACDIAGAEQFRDWSNRIDEIPAEDSYLVDRCWQSVGKYHQRRGAYERAIDAYEKGRIAAREDADDYNVELATKEIADCYFALGDADNAISSLRELVDPDFELLPECERRLVAGDVAGLIDELRKQDESAALRWLTNHDVRWRLWQVPDCHLVAQAFSSFTPKPIWVQDSAALIFPIDKTFETGRIEQAARAALEGETHVRDLGMGGWMINGGKCGRILLVEELERFDTSILPKRLAKELDAETKTLNVYLMDADPKPAERLFRMLSQLADSDAIAASWSSYTWHGEDLQEQLAWNGHVPLNHRTVHEWLEPLYATTVVDAGDDEPTEAPAKEWSERIDAAGNQLNVQIATCYLWNENLPAEATAIDANTLRITVVPGKDSAIHPMIRAGVSIRLPHSLVKLPGE